MANKEHLEIIEKGIAAWNEWRNANRGINRDLSGADLSGADLSKGNLVATSLDGANLTAAALSEANLLGANLNKANLSGADLRAANLNGANLNGADLRGAHLGMANLDSANLINANLSNCLMVWTQLDYVDLSECEGLESVKHEGPSRIGIATIYRSGGKIPFAFLRGAGVPDNFIEYMYSLVGTGFDYYSCFISYSSKNQDFAERLYADLQAKGVRCWFAPHEGQAGRKLYEQIDEAIRLHEKLLLILSAESIKSEWVKTEIKKAAKRQAKEKEDVLFPVSLVSFGKLREWECFDADLGKDLAVEVREYLIPDFSRWKTDHDSYKKAFEKLLRDLKSGKTKQVAAGTP